MSVFLETKTENVAKASHSIRNRFDKVIIIELRLEDLFQQISFWRKKKEFTYTITSTINDIIF